MTAIDDVREKISRLRGPILVLGGSGFIGANLFHDIVEVRDDVFAVTSGKSNWRNAACRQDRIIEMDLLVDINLKRLLETVEPRTIFNCLAYGAYSFETEEERIYQTNFILTSRILSHLRARDIACYVHAGSSSEYGDNSSAPDESALARPNSDYSVSKAATAQLLSFWGRKFHFPCANLRLYSCYGPWEDSSRLIPTLVRQGLEGKLPNFVHAEVSHDFIWIKDACNAFYDCAINLRPEDYGSSFNIGTGRKLTIGEVAQIAKTVFHIAEEPKFGSMETRKWDLADWYADPSKARERLAWSAKVTFEEGLKQTATWLEAFGDKDKYLQLSKRFNPSRERSVSAIIACYKDEQAIPEMYSRLKSVFTKLNVEHEIIFVNDCSPDNSESLIRELSLNDSSVIGISHSRNFGSQAAFMSGLDVASKNSCVLLDGDLQDPPELIESFFQKWCEGFDVIYGDRIDRQESLLMRFSYKAFYRIFNKLSNIHIPRDAGDFSLIDRRVVVHILQFPERDLFLRGVRAFVGFRQTGVPYVRPKRKYGVSTNNIFKNIGWAKKGILSYSNTPLNILSLAGVALFLFSVCAGSLQFVARIFFPALAPRGITSILLLVTFFGSINLLALALIGEYIGKIFEEVKQRPRFIRRAIVRNGATRPCDIVAETKLL